MDDLVLTMRMVFLNAYGLAALTIIATIALGVWITLMTEKAEGKQKLFAWAIVLFVIWPIITTAVKVFINIISAVL